MAPLSLIEISEKLSVSGIERLFRLLIKRKEIAGKIVDMDREIAESSGAKTPKRRGRPPKAADVPAKRGRPAKKKRGRKAKASRADVHARMAKVRAARKPNKPKSTRTPEEQAEINARMAKARAARKVKPKAKKG